MTCIGSTLPCRSPAIHSHTGKQPHLTTPSPHHPPGLRFPCINPAERSLKSLKPSSLNAALQRSINALLAAFSCSDTPPAAATASATVCAGGAALLLLLLPPLLLLMTLTPLVFDPRPGEALLTLTLAGMVAASEGKSAMLFGAAAVLLLLLPPPWPGFGGRPERRTGTQAGCACVTPAADDAPGSAGKWLLLLACSGAAAAAGALSLSKPPPRSSSTSDVAADPVAEEGPPPTSKFPVDWLCLKLLLLLPPAAAAPLLLLAPAAAAAAASAGVGALALLTTRMGAAAAPRRAARVRSFSRCRRRWFLLVVGSAGKSS
jgi:hypothetical protein